MGASDSFNIESALSDWVKLNCSAEDMTPADTRDIREHMLFTVQELISEKELTEEEAFAVAKIRFGGKEDWAEEMQTVNEKNFQLKKLIILFTGVFAFIFTYYFILCLDKIIFLTLNYFNGNIEANIEVVKTFINMFYLLLIFFLVAAFFMHKPITLLLNKFEFRSSSVVLFILVTFVVVILEWFLVTKVSGSIKDTGLRTTLFFIERDFKYYYLLIWGIGYVVLFLRYYRKFNN